MFMLYVIRQKCLKFSVPDGRILFRIVGQKQNKYIHDTCMTLSCILRDGSTFSLFLRTYAGGGGSMAAYDFKDDVKMTTFPPLNHHFLGDERIRLGGRHEIPKYALKNDENVEPSLSYIRHPANVTVRHGTVANFSLLTHITQLVTCKIRLGFCPAHTSNALSKPNSEIGGPSIEMFRSVSRIIGCRADLILVLSAESSLTVNTEHWHCQCNSR